MSKSQEVVETLSGERIRVKRQWDGEGLASAAWFTFLGLVGVAILGLIVWGYILAFVHWSFLTFLLLLAVPLVISLFILYFGYWGNKRIEKQGFSNGVWYTIGTTKTESAWKWKRLDI